MQVTGKNPRMFFRDKEIDGVTSFSLHSGDDFSGDAFPLPFSDSETVTFEGIYDPVDEETWESISAKLGDEFIGTITLPNGEKRDALLRVTHEDGVVTISPVDEEIREWVKGWILEEAGRKE